MDDRIARFDSICATDTDCIRLAHRLKWPSGFCCPSCGHLASYTISTRKLPLYECRSCTHQTSLTAGTAMDKSRTPLRKWLLAMFLLASSEDSINAVELSKLIQVTYKTAWSMLHKLRTVISQADRRILLSGDIEAKLDIYMKQAIPTFDATQREKAVIAARSSTHDRDSYYKIKLLQSEQRPRGFLSKQAEYELMKQHIDPNSKNIKIYRRYNSPPHNEAFLSHFAKEAFSWLNNTFHGIALKHAQLYLDEFCFRQNYIQKSDQCPFRHLLKLCLSERLCNGSTGISSNQFADLSSASKLEFSSYIRAHYLKKPYNTSLHCRSDSGGCDGLMFRCFDVSMF
ncbi:Transposase zinc-ribbon domain protein [compost metagenome]